MGEGVWFDIFPELVRSMIVNIMSFIRGDNEVMTIDSYIEEVKTSTVNVD